MFRRVSLSIIRSFPLYTQQCQNCTSVLILLANCQQVCMTYIIAVCTVENSWWWTEKLSETCRVLFWKQIWEISASIWFYYKNLSRCTVTWTSNTHTHISRPQRGLPTSGQMLLQYQSAEVLIVTQEKSFGLGSVGEGSFISGRNFQRKHVDHVKSIIPCRFPPMAIC